MKHHTNKLPGLVEASSATFLWLRCFIGSEQNGFEPTLRVKTRVYSWFLAVAYLLCGLFLFRLVTGVEAMMLDLGTPHFGLFKSIVLLIGPWGWLILGALGSLVIVVKDRKFSQPLLNLFFTAVLITVFSVVSIVALTPLVGPLISDPFDFHIRH